MTLLPGFAQRFLRRHVRDPRIVKLPSRRYLHEILLPALAADGRGRMLFVGVQSYNLPFYRHCTARGMKVCSIDPDPAGLRYGAPDGHYVGIIQDIAALADGRTFDVIVFNGVLGFGVNSAADALAALAAMARVAEPGAILVIGWNPGRTDGQEIAAMRPRLTAVSLGDVPQSTAYPPLGRPQRDPHLYEIFRFGAG